MRRIFVDTSAWDAIADGGDPNHELALLFRDEIAGQCSLITSNYFINTSRFLSQGSQGSCG
jgi:predicted nucleic acid-binding protein